eukprot:2581566-Prymnesium_polylepis.1
MARWPWSGYAEASMARRNRSSSRTCRRMTICCETPCFSRACDPNAARTRLSGFASPLFGAQGSVRSPAVSTSGGARHGATLAAVGKGGEGVYTSCALCARRAPEGSIADLQVEPAELREDDRSEPQVVSIEEARA